MSSISRLDRLIAQLRTQLHKRERSASSSPAGARQDAAAAAMAGRNAPLEAVRALKAAGVRDERALVARLVEGLLVEDLGDDLANAAEFHQTVGVVVGLLAEDAEAWALCQACVREA